MKITRAPGCKCTGPVALNRLDPGHMVAGIPCADCGELAVVLSGPLDELITELIALHEASLAAPAPAAAREPEPAPAREPAPVGAGDSVQAAFGRWLDRTSVVPTPARPADNSRRSPLA